MCVCRSVWLIVCPFVLCMCVLSVRVVCLLVLLFAGGLCLYACEICLLMCIIFAWSERMLLNSCVWYCGHDLSVGRSVWLRFIHLSVFCLCLYGYFRCAKCMHLRFSMYESIYTFVVQSTYYKPNIPFRIYETTGTVCHCSSKKHFPRNNCP